MTSNPNRYLREAVLAPFTDQPHSWVLTDKANEAIDQLNGDPSLAATTLPYPVQTTTFLNRLTAAVAATDAVMAKVLHNIKTYGRHVTGVFPGPGDEGKAWDSYNYTTGLTETLDIELVIATLRLEVAIPFLNRVANRLTAVPAEGDRLDGILGNGFTARLRRCNDLERFVMTRRVYDCDPGNGVWQVLWPDTDGLFPDEDGYNHTDFPQPLY